MLFYFTLFLGFFYFKVFRVRRLHQGPSMLTYTEGFFTMSFTLALIVFGLINMTWYLVIPFAFISYIVSALMISAVQLGMFVDGKPILVMAQIFRLTPVFSIVIIASTLMLILQ